MWRRLLSSHLKSLASLSSSSSSRSAPIVARFTLHNSSPLSPSSYFLTRHFSTESSGGNVVKKKVEDVMPIATGHEREELEAKLEGREVHDTDNPEGPFGTKVVIGTRCIRNFGCWMFKEDESTKKFTMSQGEIPLQTYQKYGIKKWNSIQLTRTA